MFEQCSCFSPSFKEEISSRGVLREFQSVYFSAAHPRMMISGDGETSVCEKAPQCDSFLRAVKCFWGGKKVRLLLALIRTL